MRFRFWAIVAVATVAVVACGGSSGSDATEAGLRTRAESQSKAQSDGDWAGWYKFFSPGNKSVCTEADFSAAADLSMSTFRESRALEESDELEFRVQEVTVNGTQGLIIGSIYLDGELLIDSAAENWVFADGDWWSVNTVPECLAPSPTPTPTPPRALERADTPTPVPGAFDEADMRALLSDQEVEAAIPLLIPDVAFVELFENRMEGFLFDSLRGITFVSADRSTLTVQVSEFKSPEKRQQMIAISTAEAGADLVRIEPIIGDESFLVQKGFSARVEFLKGGKGVMLSVQGNLPVTQAVLDGLIALAKLAASRLSSD